MAPLEEALEEFQTKALVRRVCVMMVQVAGWTPMAGAREKQLLPHAPLVRSGSYLGATVQDMTITFGKELQSAH
jgi:hypothetical protein